MVTQRKIDEAPSLVQRAIERGDVSRRIEPVVMDDPQHVRKGFHEGL